VIEADALFVKLLRIHEHVIGEVIPISLSPKVGSGPSSIPAFEYLNSGRQASRPAHLGLCFLYFPAWTKRRRQNRTNSERKFLPRKKLELGINPRVRFCSAHFYRLRGSDDVSQKYVDEIGGCA